LSSRIASRDRLKPGPIQKNANADVTTRQVVNNGLSGFDGASGGRAKAGCAFSPLSRTAKAGENGMPGLPGLYISITRRRVL
jgi:hypothetical protein